MMKIPTNKTSAIGFSLIVFVYSIIIMIGYLKHGFDNINPLFLLLLSVEGLSPMFYYVIITWKKYEIDEKGVTEYWIFGIKRRYEWEDFQVFRIAELKVEPTEYTRYFILSKIELPYPLEGATTKATWYQLQHPFTTILIEFTPERYQEFREKFPDIWFQWENR